MLDRSPPVPVIPVRAGLIIALFLTTLIACSIAAFLFRRTTVTTTIGGYPTKLFSLLSVFSGGVFLATCLLDLLPDAQESLRKVEEMEKFTYRYPVVQFSVAVGFLFVLSTEQIILFIRESRSTGSTDMDGHIITNYRSSDPLGIEHSDYGNDENLLYITQSHSTVRVVLLVMVLSLHAVFEGLSLGLVDDVNEILQIFFALLLHKTIVGFSLGVRLVQSTLSTTMILLCSVAFAAQIIFGGFAGIAVLDFISQGSPFVAGMVSAVAQAVASGTFLYITSFEILPQEFHERQLRISKLFSLIAGFILIAGLIALFPNY